MGFYEDKRDGVVVRAMDKYGVTMHLVVPAAGAFVPATGAFTPGTDQLVSVRGLLGKYVRQRKQELTHGAQQYVYLSASGLAVVPAVNHKLRVAGVDYEITSVEEVSPGGIVVLYQLTVVRP
jgi:hypothetical protein